MKVRANMEPSKQELAQSIANEFAQHVAWECSEGFQEPFELARRLKALGGEAEEYRDAVEAYCRLTYSHWLDTWTEVVRVWDKIQFPHTGRDTFARAAEQAREQPIPMPLEPPDEAYAFVYSLAWHLALHTCPMPFLLPVALLADELKCDKSTASRINRWLEQEKLIECVEPHSYGSGRNRAKKYQLGRNAT